MKRLIIIAEERYKSVKLLNLAALRDAGDRILHLYQSNQPLDRADEKAILEYMRTLKALIQRAGQIREAERPARG